MNILRPPPTSSSSFPPYTNSAIVTAAAAFTTTHNPISLCSINPPPFTAAGLPTRRHFFERSASGTANSSAGDLSSFLGSSPEAYSTHNDQELLSLLRSRRTDEAWAKYVQSTHLPGPTCLSRLVSQLSYQSKPESLTRAQSILTRLRNERQLHRLDANSLGLLAMAAAKSGQTLYAVSVIKSMLRSGYLPHVKAWTAAVANLSAAGDDGPEESIKLFTAITRRVRRFGDQSLVAQSRPDTAAFNAVLNACANIGDTEKYSKLFGEMSEWDCEPDVLTYNVMIKLCARVGRKELIVFVVERIIEKGVKPCHVVYTDFRPTPLQHYAFPMGGSGLYLVVDENEQFREANFIKMHDTFPKPKSEGKKSANGKSGGRGAKGGGGSGGGDSDVYKIVKMIMERKFQPVIIFSFSRRECENHALSMSKLDFNTEEEKGTVEEVFNNAMLCLNEEDRSLSAIEMMLPLLQRGIAVHHSGLLPVLKELVELLFQEGLVKALFATETFAMGLNMPAKTVVFTAVKKWDGDSHRFIGSGEYIQMSGRAGRRGKDERGICIIMIDEQESIIFLPPAIKMVFLSATMSNATEFAEWICYLHKQPCHVVYTDFRPTPLQHYAFPMGGSGLYLVVDENEQFRDANFIKMHDTFPKPKSEGKKSANGKSGGRGGAKGGGGGGGGDSDVYKIVKMIMERKFQPVIIFSFSRRECENHALSMSKLDFNTEEEKSTVEEVFNNAMLCLNEEDRSLSAIEMMLPLLQRGIAVHHSGLLPVLKELVELLFQEGLVKALFATETFAMGLNMPAKTVVFTAVKKWDGDSHRFIGSGEYIQMSGRAGRRGKDERGICIIMIDEQLRSSRNFCIDIVLLCIVLGIAAYLYNVLK
ncbi:hypothetical protein F2Q70_00023716 [Brassica cretica]|uniref:Helicase C-terminal domain-containing protein n=1 Tax=Brassica cretica TaxID=69181 RepID=A0A8S9GTS4_BRACR|nr:hypothetical protein F2Q70_00023716 [Brassica cretica]